MRLALALIFIGHAVYAQAVTVGVIAAVPLTDTFATAFIHEGTFDAKTVRYQVGPAIDMRLPWSFRVEIDALYQPFSFNESNFGGTPSQSHISGNLWQFPVLLKYRVPTPLVKPFVEAGPSVQIETNLLKRRPPLSSPHRSFPIPMHLGPLLALRSGEASTYGWVIFSSRLRCDIPVGSRKTLTSAQVWARM